MYALSAKTESEKWRLEIGPDQADWLLSQGGVFPVSWAMLLPANLQARLSQLVGDEPVYPVVKVCCRRYAVEDAQDRFTLDVNTYTNRGVYLPFQVLEFKSTDAGSGTPGLLQALHLQPIKLSKFLWATKV